MMRKQDVHKDVGLQSINYYCIALACFVIVLSNAAVKLGALTLSDAF
jgi:hypothetical protein